MSKLPLSDELIAHGVNLILTLVVLSFFFAVIQEAPALAAGLVWVAAGGFIYYFWVRKR